MSSAIVVIPPLHRPRVLLADDNARFIELVCELLRRDFQIVGTARDGATALAASISLQPDLVVSDISMPAMNGLELTARLQAVGHCARIVIATIHEDADLVQAARASGALGYVLKSRVNTDLPAALRLALLGQPFVSPGLEAVEDVRPDMLQQLSPATRKYGATESGAGRAHRKQSARGGST